MAVKLPIFKNPVQRLSDLKRTLHSLNENEEMAVTDAEDVHAGILQRVETTEEVRGGLQQARKRHRRDNCSPKVYSRP